MYERTCGTKDAAEKRVTELKNRYDDAVYFEGELPKDISGIINHNLTFKKLTL